MVNHPNRSTRPQRIALYGARINPAEACPYTVRAEGMGHCGTTLRLAVPTARIGHAIVRALRELAREPEQG